MSEERRQRESGGREEECRIRIQGTHTNHSTLADIGHMTVR